MNWARASSCFCCCLILLIKYPSLSILIFCTYSALFLVSLIFFCIFYVRRVKSKVFLCPLYVHTYKQLSPWTTLTFSFVEKSKLNLKTKTFFLRTENQYPFCQLVKSKSEHKNNKSGQKSKPNNFSAKKSKSELK